MPWFRINALIRKDLNAVLRTPATLIPSLILPLVLCGLLPIGLTAGLLLAPLEDFNLGPLKAMFSLYPVPAGFGPAESMLFVMLNYSFLPMFLMVPVMGAVIMATSGIVGEREHKTLETLLYTPLTNLEFLLAKLLGPLIMAEVLCLAGFALFFVGTNAVWMATKGVGAGLIVRDPLWFPILLLVVPLVNALSMGGALLLSMKAKNFLEAQQRGGVMMLPLVVLLYLIGGGVVVINAWVIAGFVLIAGTLGFWLLQLVAKKLTREELTRTL